MNAPTHDKTAEAKGLLKRLKGADLSNAPTSLWVLHRDLKDGEASYKIARVNIDAKLEGKLRYLLANHVDRANELRPYEFESADQDDQILVHTIAGTDFADILPVILSGTDAPVVEKMEELNGAWATLIVSHRFPDDPVIAFRKAPERWSVKRLNSFYNVAFANNTLVSLDENAILRIDQRIDFIGFHDQLFILSKRAFEAGLNFRTGMEARRDALIGRMEGLKVFKNVELLAEACGSNMHYLRKFSVIEQAGYYQDKDFLEKLQHANARNNWGLVFQDGQLCITAESLKTVITVLSNRRMQSMVNDEKFDVEGSVTPLRVIA